MLFLAPKFIIIFHSDSRKRIPSSCGLTRNQRPVQDSFKASEEEIEHMSLYGFLGTLHWLALFHSSLYLENVLSLQKQSIIYKPLTLDLTMWLALANTVKEKWEYGGSNQVLTGLGGFPCTLASLWERNDPASLLVPEKDKCHMEKKQTAGTNLSLDQSIPVDLQTHERK